MRFVGILGMGRDVVAEHGDHQGDGEDDQPEERRSVPGEFLEQQDHNCSRTRGSIQAWMRSIVIFIRT